MINKRNSDAGGDQTAKPVRREWTAAEIKKLTRLAGSGATQAVIGRAFGISKQRVGQLFKQFGIAACRPEPSGETVKLMHEFYQTGKTFQAVARKFRISHSKVAKLFARENLSVRKYTETPAVRARREKKSRMRLMLPVEDLERMFLEEDLHVSVIAAHFGCHASKILRELKLLGISKRRPRKRLMGPNALDWAEREKLLRRQLLVEHKSVSVIAAELGCTARAIYQQLRKLGIKIERAKKPDSITEKSSRSVPFTKENESE